MILCFRNKQLTIQVKVMFHDSLAWPSDISHLRRFRADTPHPSKFVLFNTYFVMIYMQKRLSCISTPICPRLGR